tara:strand:+ start:876 stop:1049 length:174 start_codon:yes stop_codon:yes gene_type:complete
MEQKVVIKRTLEDHLESKLELNDEMKERLKELGDIKKEDELSSEDALQYLQKIKSSK